MEIHRRHFFIFSHETKQTQVIWNANSRQLYIFTTDLSHISSHLIPVCCKASCYILRQVKNQQRVNCGIPTKTDTSRIKMPPRADEHTVLLDDKSDADALEQQQQDSGFDCKIFSTRNPTSLRHCRLATMWTLAATVLVAIVTICFRSYNAPMHERMTTTSTATITDATLKTVGGKKAKKIQRLTNSKYKKVQGIGFQIYTGGAPAFLKNHSDGTTALNPECIGRESYGQVVGEEAPMLQCYIGLPDPMLDVRGRIEIMMDAVEKAYAVVTAAENADDSETLKVFIAPEFYWRGITGAYSFEYDELPDDPSFCGPICQILVGLENIVAQERFEDWVFLFGTIVASDTLPTDDPYGYLFYNFAPVYKGYNPDKMGFVGKRFLVPKRYVSSSDFLTPQRHLNETSFKQLIGQPPGDTTVYNPHDFNQRRYDPTMWTKYKDELGVLG